MEISTQSRKGNTFEVGPFLVEARKPPDSLYIYHYIYFEGVFLDDLLSVPDEWDCQIAARNARDFQRIDKELYTRILVQVSLTRKKERKLEAEESDTHRYFRLKATSTFVKAKAKAAA